MSYLCLFENRVNRLCQELILKNSILNTHHTVSANLMGFPKLLCPSTRTAVSQ